MIRRSLLLLLTTVVAASGCNSQLGRTTPVCGDTITSAVIISAQSVRGVAYVPCVAELKLGWEYEDLEARSGQTRFWLSSDRVGNRFLEVSLEPACAIPVDATEIPSDEPSIPLFVDDGETDYYISVTVISEGDDLTHRRYAAAIAREIDSIRVGSRFVQVDVDTSTLPTADRIQAALDDGRAVLAVGAREYEEHTVELHVPLPNGEIEVTSGLVLIDAIEKVGEPLGDPAYRAVWYYPFENGCVTYRFDAEGPGAESVASDVKDALSFVELAPWRVYGEQFGLVIP